MSMRKDDHSDKSFRNAIDKLINTLESSLFSSLLDIHECHELSITGNNLNFSSEVIIDRIHTNVLNGSSSIPDHTSTPRVLNSDEQISGQGDWEYLDIVLKRDPLLFGGFGFSIAGGVDNPIPNMDLGIYVTRIAPNGCADKDSRLRVDDQILTVNDINLEHVTNTEAVNTLRKAGNQLNLVVRRFVGISSGSKNDETPQESVSPNAPIVQSDIEDSGETPIWYEVQLHKRNPNVGLGFSIAGGQDMEDDNFPNTGIFITRISPGGLADKDGHIYPGDQLMQVNGVDLSQATHADAVGILRKAGSCVNLVLTRQPMSEYADDDFESVVNESGTLRKH